jgi:hypothetical protein
LLLDEAIANADAAQRCGKVSSQEAGSNLPAP